MILYDNPISSNALKVRFLAAELGMEYERRDVQLERPRPEWYLAVNPLGTIPAIDDDGFVLSESNTILRYLAAKHGRDDLYPTDPAARARVDEFMDRWSTAIRLAFYRVERHTLGLGGLPVDMDKARHEASQLTTTLDVLESLIHGPTVLESLTLADFACAPVLYRAGNTPVDLSPYPKITELRTALTGRPSFIAAGPVR